MTARPRVECPVCKQERAVNNDGRIRAHTDPTGQSAHSSRCAGVGTMTAEDARRRADIDPAKVAAMYTEKLMPIREIAAAKGCSRSHIRDVLKREKVPLRPPGRHAMPAEDIDPDEVVRLYAAGEWLRWIARRYRCRQDTIRGILVDRGVQIRPTGPAATGTGDRSGPKRLDHKPGAVTDARKNAGLTMRQLARACGVVPSLISEIEGGTRNATPAMILKLAEVLRCPPEVLRCPPEVLRAKRDPAAGDIP